MEFGIFYWIFFVFCFLKFEILLPVFIVKPFAF
jgi:hypothetical protein